jgi:hypothetical protein
MKRLSEQYLMSNKGQRETIISSLDKVCTFRLSCIRHKSDLKYREDGYYLLADGIQNSINGVVVTVPRWVTTTQLGHVFQTQS